MWEEGPEVHSSSVGAVLAGLTMWHDHGFYDYKYRNHIDISHIIPVSERFLEDGARALSKLLPRESESRPYDLAQLSLLWPYNILKDQFALQEEILDNIERHLVRAHGVVRYPGDRYFNANQDDPFGHEARVADRPGLAVDRLLEADRCRRCASARSRATIDRYLERAKLHLVAPRGDHHARRAHRRALHRRQGRTTTCRSAGRSRSTSSPSCRCVSC